MFLKPKKPLCPGQMQTNDMIKAKFPTSTHPYVFYSIIKKKKMYNHSLWLRNSPQHLVFFISLGVIAIAINWLCGVYECVNRKLGEYMYAVLECVSSLEHVLVFPLKFVSRVRAAGKLLSFKFQNEHCLFQSAKSSQYCDILHFRYVFLSGPSMFQRTFEGQDFQINKSIIKKKYFQCQNVYKV